jgi:uncharacterized membrane protein YhaH (DUF805 family)
MSPKIKSPYRRAAFWIAVLVIAASAAIYPSTKGTFMTEGQGPLFYAGYAVVLPGAFLGAEITSIAMRFDPLDSTVIALNGWYWLRLAAPVFSWMIYFGLVSVIIRIRAAKKA